jgi:hypothetical protein
MVVSELIELLQTLPQDSLVIMSKDGEGNSYSPFSGFGEGIYVAETTWRGDYYDTEDAEDYKEEADDWVACVSLWPTN